MCREAKKGVGGAAGRPSSVDVAQGSEAPTQADGGAQSRRASRSKRVRFSSHGDIDLRSWMLARGNLVYAAAGGGTGGTGGGGGGGGGGGEHGNGVPLMLKLHAFFDAKAVFDAKAPGSLATIDAEDVRKALHELGLRASQPSTPGRGVSFGAPSSTEVAPRLSAASSGFSPITSSPPPSSLPSKPPSVLPSAEPSALPSPMVTPLPTPDVTPTKALSLSVLQGVAALEPALDSSRPPPPATPID